MTGLVGASAFAALRAELASNGSLQRKNPRPILLQLALHLTILVAGLSGFFFVESWPIRALGLLALTFGFVGVATNTHTSAHGATSESTRLNDALTWFGYSFIGTLSTTYWKQKHNILHHLNPNIDGVDPDHDFLPVFALTDMHRARQGPLTRMLAPFQGLLFPFATLLLVPNMMAIGLKTTVDRVIATRGRDPRAMRDLAGLVLSIAVWWVLPLLVISPGELLLMNGVRLILSSAMFFAIFAPAHLPHEAPFYAQGAQPKDHLALQTMTTLNFRAPTFLRYLFSGLEFQIEHHLFPNVSHVQLPKLAPTVKRICLDYGLPYRELSWTTAVWKSLRVGARLKPAVLLEAMV